MTSAYQESQAASRALRQEREDRLDRGDLTPDEAEQIRCLGLSVDEWRELREVENIDQYRDLIAGKREAAEVDRKARETLAVERRAAALRGVTS